MGCVEEMGYVGMCLVTSMQAELSLPLTAKRPLARAEFEALLAFGLLYLLYTGMASSPTKYMTSYTLQPR